MEGLNCGHMAIKLVLLLLICILPFMASSQSSSKEFTDQRASLRRIDDKPSMTFTERFLSAVNRSKRRVENIEAVINRASKSLSMADDTDGVIQTTIIAGQGEYLMEVGVGSPAVKFQGIADTGSDLLWIQCQPCQECFEQSTPIFDPAKSSTYSKASCSDRLCPALGSFACRCNPDCGYTYTYGDGSSTSGVLSRETFSIGSGSGSTFKNIGFGCSHDSEGQGFQGAGLVGLGRGPLSLIVQLGSKIDNRFSYCLVDMSSNNASSPMFFGQSAMLRNGKSLTLKKNRAVPTFWYVPITGVTVAGKALKFPPGAFDLQEDGTGGMIIDSGTTLTYFKSEAYQVISTAIASLIKLPRAQSELDLCYRIPSGVESLSLPSVVLNFEGGVNMELPAENMYITLDMNTLCVAINPNNEFGILGNIQQQNFHFLYDHARNQISFEPANCASL